MKLGFSNVACPSWDLATLAEKAKVYGYSGIELRHLQGQMHLPIAPELSANPEKIGQLIRDTGVELVCLSTSAAFHSRDAAEVAEQQSIVREYVELAGRLGCPMVRVFAGEVPRNKLIGYERRETVLARIARAIRELAPHAAAHRTTVVIENGGDFADSASLWYLVDAAASPAVKCCWNPFAARTRGERPTTSIPRLGSKIGLVHVCDGKFQEGGGLEGHALPGQGQVEIARMVQLLKGIGYAGYLMLDWPKLWVPGLADPDKALPTVAQYLQKLIEEKPIVMTAYKGDKNAPRQGRAAVGA